MAKIMFLVSETDTAVDGNYLRFANELLLQGQEIFIGFVDRLGMLDSEVVAEAFALLVPLTEGAAFPEFSPCHLASMDTIWVMSLGIRSSFLDKIQLLYNVRARTRIINSLDGLMYFKSKYFLASNAHIFAHPETCASTDPDKLYRKMLSSGGKWIAKPPAGSLGRDVFLISASDKNSRAILQNLTGPDSDQYCLLQAWVPEIEQGEKRVLIAGGQPVGQYLRQAVSDHRTNVMQGATISKCELGAEETLYCQKIGAFLKNHGIEYCGIDLVYPWVIEFNVVNPGGLTTLADLTGEDLTKRILSLIVANEESRS